MMLQRVFTFCLLALTLTAYGQVPRNIKFTSPPVGSVSSESPLACVDQFAGTATQSLLPGAQTNDITYLCLGDGIFVDHAGNANLTGDPQGATVPGIAYAFYSCPPTVSGPSLTAILADPCVINNTIPPPTNGIWVAPGLTPGGDVEFVNDGFLQTNWNAGSPIEIYFAPITVDDFGALGFEQIGGAGVAGPCTNSNTADVFSVVYLNEVQSTSVTVNGLGGSFTPSGGLPQFDGSNYTISIVKQGGGGIGMVTNGGITNNETANFTVPSAGTYNITIEDGKSCSKTITANFLAPPPAGLTFTFSNETVPPGASTCVEVSVSGFNNIASMDVIFEFDPAVLQFVGASNITLPFLGTANFSEIGPGQILLGSWFSLLPNGSTVLNGTTIFELCFDAIGADGTSSGIDLQPFSDFIFTAIGDQEIASGVAGSVNISSAIYEMTLTGQNISCGETPALTDGAMTVSASGSAAPYAFAWQLQPAGASGNGSILANGGSSVVSGLAAGTYGVTVTSALGEVTSSTVVISSLPPIFLSLNSTDPTCATLCDGGVSINSIGGGQPPFTFEWNDGTTNASLTNQCTGTYTLTVTDVNGCTRAATTSIGINPIQIVGFSATPASCEGINDGSVVISAVVGGTAPSGNYIFNWSVGNFDFGTGSFVPDLGPGEYCVTVSDDNGCEQTQCLTVDALKTLGLNDNVLDVGCFAGTTGSISLVGVTIGSAPALPYNFVWAPGGLSISNTPTGSQASALAAGIYSVTMTDVTGCQIDTFYTIDEPAGMVITLQDLNDESCEFGNDGNITVSVTGGNIGAGSDYGYAWTGALTGATITGLSAGLYTVTVTDDNSCSMTSSFTVDPPQPPTITNMAVTSLNCAQDDDGIINVFATPGLSPIVSYTWSSSADPLFSQTGATITGLVAGTYTVTVTGQDGCFISSSTQVVAPAIVALQDTTLTLETCPGFGNGQIIVFMQGGVPPYSYAWSGGPTQGAPVFSTLGAGSYTFSITDANLCPTFVITVELPAPAAINVAFSDIQAVSCSNGTGSCDGEATALASGGTAGTGLFNFVWQSNTTATGSSSTATNLCQGDSYVVVSDGVCGDTFPILIPAPLPISAAVISAQTTCFGLCDGSASVNAVGGTPTYSYLWNTNQVGAIQTGLCAGDYTITVTDNNGCDFVVSTSIGQPDSLIAVINPNATFDVSCYGLSDGRVTVAWGGGNGNLGPATYTWTGNVSTTESAINLPSGIYVVTVTDILGCSDTAIYLLNQPTQIIAIIPIPELPLCNGFQTTITVDTVFGGNGGPYRFRVDFGPDYEPDQPAPVYAGDHLISIVDYGNGLECTLDSVIFVDQPPVITVDLGPDLEIELGETIQLDPIITSALPLNFDSIFWSPLQYLTPDNDPRTPFVGPYEPTTYTLTVYDINGCFGSDDIYIDVDRNRNVFIPNVFTPNGDENNDRFQVHTGLGVTKINYARIFDRWGELVYEEKAIIAPGSTTGWDGSFRGKELDPAVYIYVVEVEFLDGVKYTYHGDLTLMK